MKTVLGAILVTLLLVESAEAMKRYCWIYANVVDATGQTVRAMQRAGEIDESKFKASNLSGCQKSRKYEGKILHFCSNYVVRIFDAKTGEEVKDPSYGWNCGKPPGKTENFNETQTNFATKGFRHNRR